MSQRAGGCSWRGGAVGFAVPSAQATGWLNSSPTPRGGEQPPRSFPTQNHPICPCPCLAATTADRFYRIDRAQVSVGKNNLKLRWGKPRGWRPLKAAQTA